MSTTPNEVAGTRADTGRPRVDRVTGLDVARGVAILGTLGTNIWIFSHPRGFVGYVSGLATGTVQGAEALARQLANGKFLGMLTLMFGIGLALQHRSALGKGLHWPGRYPWRASLLFLDGLLHYVLVIEFDVLMGYAVTGVIAAYVLAGTDRTQKGWLWGAAVVHGLVIAVLAFGAAAGGVPTPDVDDLYSAGSWWDQIVFRLDHIEFARAEPVYILAMSIALFLFGSRLLRDGLFEERGRRLRRWLIVTGLVALPVDLTIGICFGQAGWFLSRYGTAPLVALGMLGAVAMLTERRRRPGAVQRRLAEIGRTALSGYVLQNVLCSILFYGWGLGLATRLGEARPWWTLVIYVTVCGVLGILAHLWLRRYRQGPLEALWTRMYAWGAGNRN